MDDKELADKINELYTKYADEKIISKKFGISVAKVREYVKVARLAESLKDEVGVIKIPLDEIDEDCDSTRTSPPKDLIEHIAQHGLLEPIIVCKSGNGKYEILDIKLDNRKTKNLSKNLSNAESKIISNEKDSTGGVIIWAMYSQPASSDVSANHVINSSCKAFLQDNPNFDCNLANYPTYVAPSQSK